MPERSTSGTSPTLSETVPGSATVEAQELFMDLNSIGPPAKKDKHPGLPAYLDLPFSVCAFVSASLLVRIPHPPFQRRGKHPVLYRRYILKKAQDSVVHGYDQEAWRKRRPPLNPRHRSPAMANVNPNDCTLNSTCAPASAINPAGFPTEQVDNMGYRFWLTLVVLVICSGLIVALRVASRLKMKQMGADDYLILAALVRAGLECPACPLVHILTFYRCHSSRSPRYGQTLSG